MNVRLSGLAAAVLMVGLASINPVTAIPIGTSPAVGESLRSGSLLNAVENCAPEKMKALSLSLAIKYILAARKTQTEIKPMSEGARLSAGMRLLNHNRFSDLSNSISEWISSADDAAQTISVGNLAVRIGDLDGAQAAFVKAKILPGGELGAQQGQAKVSLLRKQSQNHVIVAREQLKQNNEAVALDELNNAIAVNPKNWEARLLIGETLAKRSAGGAQSLRTAANHYRAYLALSPEANLNKEKIDRRISVLENRAMKSEQKLIAADGAGAM